MYVGEQLADLSDRRLAVAALWGVEHLVVHTTAAAGVEGADGRWDIDRIEELKRRLRGFGHEVDALALTPGRLFLDLLEGQPVEDQFLRLEQNVEAAAQAGIPCLKYNFQFRGIPRTGKVVGRGGALYSSFDAQQASDENLESFSHFSFERQDVRFSQLPPITAEDSWRAIESFLERLVPVAERVGVRLACHPHDPALPAGGLTGTEHVLGSFDGLDRLLDIADSPVHGLNFCQGTVAEMCQDPATEVIQAIERFGTRGKIFLVHFRNIKGGYLRFSEVYPDNGDVDMFEAIGAYQRVGYRGILCPDHVPVAEVDPDDERQFGFCVGYTKGLLQAAAAA